MIKPLPPEILERIFGYLKGSKHDIENCMVVSKSWNRAASAIFWEESRCILSDLGFAAFLNFLDENPVFVSKLKRMKVLGGLRLRRRKISPGSSPPYSLVIN